MEFWVFNYDSRGKRRKILCKVAVIWRVLERSLSTTEYHAKKYAPVFGSLLMLFPVLKWILMFSVKEVCSALWRANVKTSYSLWQCVDIKLCSAVSSKSTEIQKADLEV